MKRLDSANVSSVPASIAVPCYDREKINAGIAHLGLGAFHRGHQAWYTDKVLNIAPDDWGIIGCSLRSTTARDQLQPQDCLYTVIEVSGAGENYNIVGAIKSAIVGPEDPSALIEALAQESIKIVTLTITEKGYCYDPATGSLNLSHPDIRHDLENSAAPVSAPGFLVAALLRRKERGLPGFTLLSCDNLPDNGHVLRTVVQDLAARVQADLPEWIEQNARFPCSMVDRIVPATTDKDKDNLAVSLGCRDEGAVVAEPFSQWVVEDDFIRGRPRWEKAGVTMVNDVRAYEAMKLRLLNASHSLLAYAGYLAGYQYICETMTHAKLVRVVTCFMDEEVTPTLEVPKGFDLDFYKQQLRGRFANIALKHRTWQVAMDGSQKLPQRQIAIIRDQLKGEGKIELSCFSLAVWMRYVKGVDEQGDLIDVQDPYAAEFKTLWDTRGEDIVGLVRDMLAIEKMFGRDLISSEKVVLLIAKWLEIICKNGVVRAIESVPVKSAGVLERC